MTLLIGLLVILAAYMVVAILLASWTLFEDSRVGRAIVEKFIDRMGDNNGKTNN